MIAINNKYGYIAAQASKVWDRFPDIAIPKKVDSIISEFIGEVANSAKNAPILCSATRPPSYPDGMISLRARDHADCGRTLPRTPKHPAFWRAGYSTHQIEMRICAIPVRLAPHTRKPILRILPTIRGILARAVAILFSPLTPDPAPDHIQHQNRRAVQSRRYLRLD